MSKEIAFESEFILHTLTQSHLYELFDLKCIASEIQLHSLRLDNLAYDSKSGSFVIIEYKNEVDLNVLNQVQEYYELVLENKQHFLNRLDDGYDVDFEKTRIMIISPEFGDGQIRQAKDNVELWKVTLYDDGKVTYQNLKNNNIETITVNPDDLKLTEERLLEDKSGEMKELYFSLKDRILSKFDDIDIAYQVDQFSFRTHSNLICIVRFLKSSFGIYIYADNLKDVDAAVDISNKTTGGNANYQIKYESDDDFDYFLSLFEQAYNQKVVK